MKKLGIYRYIDQIGKGGMGEVFLVYDPICDRKVALKKIREDLKKHDILKKRFLREASIAARLMHPGIISVYSIHQSEEDLYYTMPYIEGMSLHALLKAALTEVNDKKIKEQTSVAALLPIFSHICQSVAYAHSKKILHRDLKPENILIGKYGEVILSDWGAAFSFEDLPEEDPEFEYYHSSRTFLTSPGKPVGTPSYMSPERLCGEPATVSGDIYALGVMLYQLLTLSFPFGRKKKIATKSTKIVPTIFPPEEVAPYRDIPPLLSKIVLKCLHPSSQERYLSVNDLLKDLSNHMEGHSQWVERMSLNLADKKQWKIRENILLSQHLALNGGDTDTADWFGMLIASPMFAHNLRITAHVRLKPLSKGIGFLLTIPDQEKGYHVSSGYCLWLIPDIENLGSCIRLFKDGIEVVGSSSEHFSPNIFHHVCLERTGHKITFSVNHQILLTYVGHLPLTGSGVGVLLQNADFEDNIIKIEEGSQNLQVGCLAVPDALLLHGNYHMARAEYRQIASSFPGQAAGREALFRSGITFFEEGNAAKKGKKKLYAAALEEFSLLHFTPGAPLEYLGKSLVYEKEGNTAEELKCLELVLRRYAKHPLIDTIKEHIIYRIYQSSGKDRKTFYHLILLLLRFLPEECCKEGISYLLKKMTGSWHSFSFIQNHYQYGDEANKMRNHRILMASLAFRTGNQMVLMDFLNLPNLCKDESFIADIAFMLLETGLVKKSLSIRNKLSMFVINNHEDPCQILINKKLGDKLPSSCYQLKKINLFEAIRSVELIGQLAIVKGNTDIAIEAGQFILDSNPLEDFNQKIRGDALIIAALLYDYKGAEAAEKLYFYDIELLNNETSVLFSLMGCLLILMEDVESAHIHFSGISDGLFPETHNLLAAEILYNISSKSSKKLFKREEQELYRWLFLYYHCQGDLKKERFFQLKVLRNYF
ncbi:Serine/threonine-protein kinase PknD [Candidatus Clavichlamydia salmonicola]|uniref:protein kinase domain-containing protein n=1 Tax=Candidatus Clavichlamydia salmonicola TaxID=469812 RepID=UPI001890BD22|nr:protein kinase [Candidatus Clavichlamydia salmonicola]MBF5051226.1 Serine/threonine-protein kinase PknD [Candidatus Clavichlamydia salmonicola]